MSKPEKPSVFRYLDYRHYLKDWLAYMKAGQSGISLRQVAREIGLTPGYLSMLVSGRRAMTSDVIEKLAPLIKFTRQERAYLEHLVTLGSSESQEVRLRAMQRMSRFRSYRKLNPKEAEVYKYLTCWYYVAIREMTALHDFKEDAEWIQARLKHRVELAEIRAALAFLKDSGFIEMGPEGCVAPPEKRMDCDGGVFRISMAGFHRQMFTLASESIDNTPRSERNLLSHTLAVDESTFTKANDILSEAYEKIRSLSCDPKRAQAVYHLGFVLFPLTTTQSTKAIP